MKIKVNNINELRKAVKLAEEHTEILVNEGVYEFDEPLILEKDNIKIIGNSDKCVFCGSKRISISEGEKYSGDILKFDLKKYGINNVGDLSKGPYRDFWFDYEVPKPYMEDYGMGAEIFYNEKSMPIVRYPKNGNMHIVDTLGETIVGDAITGKERARNEGVFTCDDEHVKTWKNIEDILLVGYWHCDWALQRHGIKSIDPDTGKITVDEPYHAFGYAKEKPFYAVNVFEELTQKGEWYIDRKNTLLYMIPYDNQSCFDISVAEDIIVCENQNNIAVENITVCQCRKNGIKLKNCKNVHITKCVIKNCGAWAVIADDCLKASVTECCISDTGGGGISLCGGDRKSLKMSGNIIADNIIYNVAKWHRVYLPALQLCGMGGEITGNKIYDCPHFGILFYGNDILIEKNELYNVCSEANDAGAIYSGKDWTCRGNVIRYNYIHDLIGKNKKGCVGIYLDDGLSSADIYENVLAGIRTAIMIGGGRDSKVENNIMINCREQYYIDNRYTKDYRKGGLQKLLSRLRDMPYQSEEWQKKYPELYNILDEEYKKPMGNTLKNNTFINCGKIQMFLDDDSSCLNMENNKEI